MATACDSLEVDLSRVDLDVTWETQPCIDVEVEQVDITIESGTVANQGPKGDVGPQGPQGDQGATGPPGPQGLPGAAATIAAGSTVTGAPGSSAIVTNSGSSAAAVFDFAIPRGDAGAQGIQGSIGPAGIPAYTLSSAGFTVPAVGSSVTVPVVDTSWVAIGEILYVQDAGGAGVAGAMQVTAKTSNSLTLLNIATSTGVGGGGGIPEAPTDSQLYGRQNAGWTVVPAGGGTGDMTKATYDTNADNIIDHAALADSASAVAWTGVTGKPSTFPPTGHNASHLDNGTDPIAVVTTTRTGLTPKLSGTASTFLNGTGAFSTPAGGGDMTKAVYDVNGDNVIDKAAALSTAGVVKQFWKNGNLWAQVDYTDLTSVPSTFTAAAHATSHKSGGADSIALDTLAATTDITTLNASITAHGLLAKLSNVAAQYLNGVGAWSNPTQGPFDLKAQTVVQSGASLAINRALGENCTLSLTASITAVTVSAWPSAGNTGKVRLIVSNTGAFTISGWPTGTIWPGGTGPVITSGAGKKDILLLMSDDGGTTIYGSIVGQDYR